MLPGYTTGNGTCYVQCIAGLQAVSDNIKLLDMNQASWVPMSKKDIYRAVIGGFENYGTLGVVDAHVCRAKWQGAWVGGKAFFPSNDRGFCLPALVEYIILYSFDILVYSATVAPSPALCSPPSAQSPCGTCPG